MAMKIRGIEAALAALTEVKREAPEAARKIVEMGAKDMAQLARDYAPVDKMDLVRSIRAQRVREGGSTTHWRIKVGGMQGDRNVSAYASMVHETFRITYGGITRGPSRTNPGKKSRAKALSLGVGVGGKFLSRAFKDMAPQLELDLANSVRNAIRKTARKTAARNPKSRKKK